ncbi:ATP-binding protein [Nocardiopsis xinjiangensis]|uniref:ATP-binding protein n=1 Tax=Nocardiopsis xinjiangensis TaxID=124285 RepID=UPI001F4CD5F7|nr:sensor histidine kinase [Nocardiopsis xinjiangensis]
MRERARRRRVSLTGQLFVASLVLLTTALAVLGLLWALHHRSQAEHQYEQRALAIARSVAATPEIRSALADGEGAGIAQAAEDVRTRTGARYVVVADQDGIRHSHPDTAQIGRPTSTDPSAPLQGRTWTGVQEGPAGLTLRAKVPVMRPGSEPGEEPESGDVAGLVSVGILVEEVETALTDALPGIVAATAGMLLLGAGGAYLISRRIRAKTHGMEPEEITELLDGREALFHSVREGVLAVGADEHITLANAPARDLLGLPEACVGDRPGQHVPDGALLDLLTGRDAEHGVCIAVGARILVCDRRPVRVGRTDGGVVVTLRDHTELTRLSDELDGVRTATWALRSQSHEYANRIHTVAGMLELGEAGQARSYLAELTAAHMRTSTEIAEHIGDTSVAALVLAKSAQANEQGTVLELESLSNLDSPLQGSLRRDVLLVVGNLVDNALQAVGEGGRVELLLREYEAEESEDGPLLEIRVIDTGPGPEPDVREGLFAPGITTKLGPGPGPRGLGLALVRQACLRRGGWVDVERDGGAEPGGETVFSACLPLVGGSAAAAGDGAGSGGGRAEEGRESGGGRADGAAPDGAVTEDSAPTGGRP